MLNFAFFKEKFPSSRLSQGRENMNCESSSNPCCEFIQLLTHQNINYQGKTNTQRSGGRRETPQNRIPQESHLLRIKHIWKVQYNFT